jgi:hypothetical protein
LEINPTNDVVGTPLADSKNRPTLREAEEASKRI